ncbi:ATP-binding protein [Uliginosibacterium sp. sgz301328]|uniref:ATP-binding protein n=1 Tax=Uliginosibacterium sp. sgz301328 TaxID=3243764 RepID=UPI00359E190D
MISLRRISIVALLQRAFLASTALTVLAGAAAMWAWYSQREQLALTLRDLVPRIESAQSLERALDALTSDFNQIVRESPEERQRGKRNAIVSHLSGIDDAARHASPPLQQAVLALTAEARQRLAELEAALDSERVAEQHLLETTQRINSLNADFNEELASLAQDIGWQEWTLVEAVARGGESAQLRRSEQSLRALQRQRQLINSVARVEAQVVEDLFRFLAARTTQEVEAHVGYLTGLQRMLDAQIRQVKPYPGMVGAQQIVVQLSAIGTDRAALPALLSERERSRQALKAAIGARDDVLGRLRSLLAAEVGSGREQLQRLNTRLLSITRASGALIVGSMAASIVFLLVINHFYIRRRLLRRFSMLAQAALRLSRGELDTPVAVFGRDELGRIASLLRRFARMVKRVEESNALTLIDDTAAALITLDAEGRIESVNAAARALFEDQSSGSVELSELMPQSWRESLKCLLAADSPLWRDGEQHLELHRDGRHFSAVLRTSPQRRRHRVIMTIADVTPQVQARQWLEQEVQRQTQLLNDQNARLVEEVGERIAAEASLRQTQDELVQSAKLAVVGQTMTTLAHELNQPLNALRAYLYTATRALEAGDVERVAPYHGRMQQLIERTALIIRRLRDFTRRIDQSSTLVAVDARQCALDAWSLLSIQYAEPVEALALPPMPVMVLADSVRLQQVFVNLLANAMQAGTPASLRVSVTAQRCDGRCVIELADNGPGWSPALHGRLLQPFATGKEVGLGLGLSVCTSIMEAFGGELRIASTVTGGALVILELRGVQDAEAGI